MNLSLASVDNFPIKGTKQEKIMKILKLFTLMAFALTLISCGRNQAKDFAEQMNSFGKDFSIVKESSNKHKEFSILKDNSSGNYYAIDMKAFKDSGLSAEEFFNAHLGESSIHVQLIDDITSRWITSGGYTIRYETVVREERELISDDEAYLYVYDGFDDLYGAYYINYTWEEQISYEEPVFNRKEIFEYHGVNGWVFEEGQADKKDLEKIAAKMEGQEVSKAADSLVAKFGLSQERAIEVAKLQNAYNKISSKRSLTQKDQDTLTKQLVGTNYASARAALEDHLNGDSVKMEELLDKAAEINGTTPEHMTEILGDILLK